MEKPSAPISKPSQPAIARLVVLPLGKSFEIAFKSIRVRFLRSLITTLSLVLAVAFFAFVQVSADITRGMAENGDAGIRQQLVRNGYDLGEKGLSASHQAKQRWILILSMMVCTVGIINAQLMAVTERFREIGTMKCLGALDRFIVRLFFLEAGMQGLAGGLLGAVLGSAGALLTGLLRFGTTATGLLRLDDLGISFGTALALGLGLSLVGVFYPALVAARMQPVEAMRIEQ